jgi:hypothetical protein
VQPATVTATPPSLSLFQQRRVALDTRSSERRTDNMNQLLHRKLDAAHLLFILFAK